MNVTTPAKSTRTTLDLSEIYYEAQRLRANHMKSMPAKLANFLFHGREITHPARV